MSQYDLSGVNPLDAPEPEPPKLFNIGRVVENKIVTIADAYADAPNGVPEGVDPAAPYWKLTIEALDSRWADGGTMYLFRGTKLFDKNGKPLDKTQRPTLVAAGFLSLGLKIYPGDPAYDESVILNQVFKFEMIKRTADDPGLRVPIANQHVGGADFVYTGEVRTVGTAGAVGEGTPGGAAVTIDLSTDSAAQTRLRDALNGTDLSDEDAVQQALKSAGLMNATLNGKGLTGHLINGTLEEALQPILSA